MREDDLSYSRRRANEEALRSLAIGNPAIAAIHRQFAEAYRQRIARLTANPARTRILPGL